MIMVRGCAYYVKYIIIIIIIIIIVGLCTLIKVYPSLKIGIIIRVYYYYSCLLLLFVYEKRLLQ